MGQSSLMYLGNSKDCINVDSVHFCFERLDPSPKRLPAFVNVTLYTLWQSQKCPSASDGTF